MGLAGADGAAPWLALFERFLTVSSYSARVLHAPPARTRIIYGGADPARFCPEPAAGVAAFCTSAG